MAFKLTVRAGSSVSRETHETLDEAIAALERHAKEIRSAGPLPDRKVLRTFESAQQVAGRIEISTGGFLRGGDAAGVDVMGDGTFVAFRGGMQRAPLELGDEGPWETVRRALGGG